MRIQTLGQLIVLVASLGVIGCSPAAKPTNSTPASTRATGSEVALAGNASASAGANVLPRAEAPFKGKTAPRPQDSIKDFPQTVQAPKGAPNVLLIMTDDVGFGASSTFGGPIATPTFDRLAARGLKFNHFHTTALCSPTRASLLTGRNHHSCSTGTIMETGTGYPGYNTLMSKSCGSVAEILKQNGYNTSWFGKNHNIPDWQSSPAGPFDLWPTGLGFEYFYGFIGGDANQWAPAIFEGTRAVEPPHGDANYHFDQDLADHAIDWIRTQHAMAPSKPFFCYYTPGTAHAPHHAPKDWIAKFKGQFDQGWDHVREETLARQKKLGVVPEATRLTPRPEGIPAWDSLNADQKKVFARMMEVYAGALSHCDHQIGRMIEAVEASGELDNTIVMFIQGDNGASAEGTAQGVMNELALFNGVREDFAEIVTKIDELGGPLHYNHYPIGWAHAMCTPFQWTKQIASHFGGTRNGLVISWPKHIQDPGGLRTQFTHVTDIMPTILEATQVEAPAAINGVQQKEIAGVSLLYALRDATAPTRHKTQYFEMFANRAIYHDGWVAATTPVDPPWSLFPAKIDPINDFKWELYHVTDDFSEANNLAEQEPAKLKELQDLFYAQAKQFDVFPLDNSKADRIDVSNRPSLTTGRTEFTYYPGMKRIPEGAAPDTKNKSWSLAADIDIPESGAEGVIATQGGRFAGWGLYLLQGTPVFHYNLADVTRSTLKAPQKLAPGKHSLLVKLAYDGGGAGKGASVTLHIDGQQVAETKLDRTIGYRIALDETFDIGEDTGTPISEDYQVPFKCTGKLATVKIRLE